MANNSGHVSSAVANADNSSAALQNCGAERQGRIRAQQALRKVANSNDSNNSYPLAPIAITWSCFSQVALIFVIRNGTPRQPLIVPLARACLVFDPTRVPPASLEGLEGYSHCWIIRLSSKYES
ncbi:hypothetical protein RND71_014991 [Anisodus tanguticus]|uniref:TsaA-like domain-containing protein n=1 Tax=Anisodus tanguticus TaxID=243964 RepID=A0AAE1SCB3_9SOLA|nr:hypothetical protein RND71_014991 [Anisodus tanguticus]